MTVLEATVEIVKAATLTTDSSLNVTDESHRKRFIKGIEEIYKKLEELEQNKPNKKSGHQS